MPRPVKWRRVEYIPKNKYFAPCPKGKCGRFEGMQEMQLKVEELEAMRLKDIEELTQEECAAKMQVSRQTFQNIIDEARKKVAIALIKDMAISVGGGHYTKNLCKLNCLSCGKERVITFEERGTACENCGSKELVCNKKRCISECDKDE